ncbi:MAG TPA: omptin family outer membrane protease [Spirochaetota bacterium]|nr:omptin family outer membrane protease [Spirochaetota bacterium]HPI90207.1 omptin family outer membrane protease [Spirochaetota bacterium]HPR46527.1 omptin family outer membrane protease [Spirochaetota bacterium]
MKKKSRPILITLNLLACLCFPLAASASPVKVETGLSVEWLSGFTMYQIGGEFSYSDGSSGSMWFPLSELVFPTNVFMTTVSLEMTVVDAFIIGGKFKHNNLFGAHDVNTYAGKMQDSDWGYFYLATNGAFWARTDSLDVFSESKAYLTAAEANFSFGYRVINKEHITYDISIGFIYQSFDYEIRDLDQWYPSYSQYSDYLSQQYSYHIYRSGEILTYRVEYFIPTIGTTLDVMLNNLILTFSLGFSPCACARDTDDHLLRYKLSEGETFGFAVFSSLSLDYQLKKFVALGIFAQLTTVYTEGEQHQEQYRTYNGTAKGDIGTIENRIISRQVSLGLRLSFTF